MGQSALKADGDLFQIDSYGVFFVVMGLPSPMQLGFGCFRINFRQAIGSILKN
jgi:hypothetical protein